MAIWQFDLKFVPRCEPMPRQGPDGYEGSAFLAQEASAARVWLSERFGPPQEMLENWFVYGPYDGNRVDLVVNEDCSAEVSARIDARTEAVDFAMALCELSGLLNGRLYSFELTSFLDVTPSALGLALERSRAAKFIRDPVAILGDADSAT